MDPPTPQNNDKNWAINHQNIQIKEIIQIDYKKMKLQRSANCILYVELIYRKKINYW